MKILNIDQVNPMLVCNHGQTAFITDKKGEFTSKSPSIKFFMLIDSRRGKKNHMIISLEGHTHKKLLINSAIVYDFILFF